jgi:CRISPR-associated protein Csm5
LYVLAGTAAVQELRPQLKDYAAQPYIPGSTLKGALRTALLDAALLGRDTPIEARRFGDRPKFAAQEIERDIAGRGERPSQAPNYDVFRSIQIADSAAISPECLTLSNVLVWPAGESGIPIDVETIAAGHIFETSLRIDEYLFSRRAEKLGMAAKRGMIERLAETCRADAAARIEAERAYFTERNERTLQRFYDGLAARLEAAGPNTWLMQIGWGAGWNSKTITRTLRAHGQIPEIVKKYRLDRGKGRGGAFPATRHVVVDSRRQPVEALGWVEVRMGDV